ncbi:hypothetical protein POI8812_00202 [Pontivivens insulae]|uniref:GtrA/DPMS transmembrane domain-containing protein n=2 Tax=Pontivivens insulae TaxID=1639689 RepID=A0A2R8A6N5_9RHOB|nr:putative flippase GtrA [Pontivivens insulae]SPF27907.1 hypothetical protein POI8812_00202 [Pontivivens insulae]
MWSAGRIARFAGVGAFVALLYVSLFLLLVANGLSHPFANAFAFFIAVVAQYCLQAVFTFRQEIKNLYQVVRFSLMILIGLVTSYVITGPIASLMALTPLISSVSTAIVLPVQNFIFMQFWVFVGDAGKR